MQTKPGGSFEKKITTDNSFPGLLSVITRLNS